MDKYKEDEILNFQRCKLEEFPEIPANIKAVNLNRNKLKKISLPRENMIEYLDVSDNIIKDVELIDTIEDMEILDLSYNLLSKVPKLNTEKLKELYLIANDIENIENIEFPSLIKLDLASNGIKKLENLKCEKLKELYLGNNKISKIENLRHLHEMVILDLQYNCLEEVDCALLPEKLEILLLKGNENFKKVVNKDKLKYLKNIF